MTVPVNKNMIGPFYFARLSPPKHVVQQTIVRRTRPGRHGVILQRLGRVGPQVEVISWEDLPGSDSEAAVALGYQRFELYTRLIGQSTRTVTWAGTQLTRFDMRYFVVDVELLKVTPIVLGKGGVWGTSRAKMECRWLLQPVKITDTPP